jgi:HNH endonuclease
VSPIPLSLRRALRAEFPEPRCAYCHSPEQLLGMPLEVDHIIPEAASGKTELANVCLCCRTCNSYKGQRIYARDPQTGRQVRIFHPRRQQWTRHFAWSADGVRLLGLTASGRATIEALQMNNHLISHLRQLWIALRLHPREQAP